LHELVGGDRNMEQTNLVVTADGKTWDEVTRDVSYIGNECLNSKPSADIGGSSVNMIYTEHRGVVTGIDLFNKDFAIAYNRFICLKDGHYNVQLQCLTSGGSQQGFIQIRKNGSNVIDGEAGPSSSYRGNLGVSGIIFFKRGDYLDVFGQNTEGTSGSYHNLSISRV